MQCLGRGSGRGGGGRAGSGTPPTGSGAYRRSSLHLVEAAQGTFTLTDDDREVGIDASTPKPDPLVGTVLFDRYEVLERLGEGGMSVVYKVKHTVLHRVYAVKVLLPHLAINPKNLKRFEQEARAASALAHPNVIAIHDFGASPEGQPYLVMDYLEGKGLNDLIHQDGVLAVDRSLGIFIQACDALALAHEKGIVHRDLKPSNIMITADSTGEDQVKIVDFGIAKLLPTEGEDVQRLTQTGEVFGSPYYMSPEQWTGKALDARSDIYSMGCVMYETLAGHAPFAGSTVHETMYKLMNEVPPGLTGLQASAEIRGQLEAILFKAIAKDPAQRYQSMRELKADLEKLRGGADRGMLSRIRNLWVVSRLRRVPARTRSKVVAVLAAIVLVLGASTAYMLSFLLSPTTQSVAMSWHKEPKPVPERDERSEKVAEWMARITAWSHNAASDDLLRKLEKLGLHYSKYQEWDKAVAAFKKALSIRQSQNPDYKQDLAYLISSMKLADCYYETGRTSDAKHYYEIAIPGMIESMATDDLSQPLANVADIYMQQGELKKAERDYRHALRYWEMNTRYREGLEKSPDYALTVSRFGDCLRLEGKLPEAKQAYAKALPLWGQLEGDGYKRNMALCQYRLGTIARSEGHLGAAEMQFKAAANTLDKIYGSQHPYLIGILNDYADLLWKENRWIDAAVTRARANAINAKATKKI